MIENRPSVHGSRVAVRFARLRQHVAYINLQGAALFQGLRHTVDEEVRHDARVETAGPEDHDVRLADRRKRRLHRLDVLGEELHAPDVFVHLGDMRLALDEGAVLHDRIEPYMRRRCRKHAPLDGENLRRLLQRLFHVARDLRHGGDEEVAEAVSLEFRTALKAILEELFHQRLRIGERDETVPEIARRDDAEFLAQPSRRAAVVGDRHDRRHIARRLLDAAQEHGKPVSAADDRDLRPLVETALLVDDVDELFRVVGQEHADDGAYDEARRKEHQGES